MDQCALVVKSCAKTVSVRQTAIASPCLQTALHREWSTVRQRTSVQTRMNSVKTQPSANYLFTSPISHLRYCVGVEPAYAPNQSRSASTLTAYRLFTTPLFPQASHPSPTSTCLMSKLVLTAAAKCLLAA